MCSNSVKLGFRCKQTNNWKSNPITLGSCVSKFFRYFTTFDASSRLETNDQELPRWHSHRHCKKELKCLRSVEFGNAIFQFERLSVNSNLVVWSTMSHFFSWKQVFRLWFDAKKVRSPTMLLLSLKSYVKRTHTLKKKDTCENYYLVVSCYNMCLTTTLSNMASLFSVIY